ncbi:MAG: 4-(cytidine 5'-diphospho)-2-C-methyl-D-erythritol kinase [Clostridia bacterium]|nr:4-(cytidine 5'-diphospho)-2-C-methyl-D-erythritol kinase [Clostridia bacterium]
MQLKIAANAKINLTLYITGKRDDGYHTLDTIMQSIGLQDLLTLSVCDQPCIAVTCSNNELAGEGNLAYQAAKRFFKAIDQRQKGVAIHIEKHIPLSAGLGGGSADAAAVLVGLNHLFNEPLSPDELKELALPLGADVPFCLVGGTCRAMGIGERLSVLPGVNNGYVVLVKPCEKESTGKMYQKYDEIKGLKDENKCVIIPKMVSNDLLFVTSLLHNDFLPLYEHEKVHEAITALLDAGAVGASLSGSGPTVFGLFADADTAQQARACLTNGFNQVFCAPFVQTGLEIL